jgi:flagellin-like hook-associated protein FlgL
MSAIGTTFFRTTNLMTGDQLLASLQRTNEQLNKAQQEIATGKRVLNPSDDALKLSAILSLRQQLEARTQYERNLQHASGTLNGADQALADVSDILIEARSIALSQIGIGSDATTRDAEAAVVGAQLSALIEIANRQIAGVGLFTGASGGDAEGNSFVSFLGGVKYTGALSDFGTDAGLSEFLPFNINGSEAFNLASGTVGGSVDLDPFATDAMKLTDVDGALNRGVRLGSIAVNVNGTQTTIDLSTARTLGDVATRINDAISTIDPAAGAMAVSGGGFALTANFGHNITITETGSGKTAADLGINVTASSTVVNGADLNPKLNALTRLSDLNTSIDLTSGLKITQGGQTRVADFSGAQTIQDLMNVVEQLDLGVKLEISGDGSKFNVINLVSGIELSIGENGGTTAEDLGIRTFGASTRLSEFNRGEGVKSRQGEDDFEIHLHDGTTFTVNIDGAVTVGDVVAAIRDAATNAGLTVGPAGDFNVDLAASGNGLVLEDLTAGGNDFVVDALGESLAAVDLGIASTAGGGSTIAGEDRATRQVDSIFTFLIDLRDSLLANSDSGISVASDNMSEGIDLLAKTRGEVGIRAQRVEKEQERSEQLGITETSLLTDLEDADLTEVITRFTQLQTQLQATMQAGAQNLRLSLLDFLR